MPTAEESLFFVETDSKQEIQKIYTFKHLFYHRQKIVKHSAAKFYLGRSISSCEDRGSLQLQWKLFNLVMTQIFIKCLFFCDK
jgi:hypothetical protein